LYIPVKNQRSIAMEDNKVTQNNLDFEKITAGIKEYEEYFESEECKAGIKEYEEYFESEEFLAEQKKRLYEEDPEYVEALKPIDFSVYFKREPEPEKPKEKPEPKVEGGGKYTWYF
jgi:hypothetical protein